MTRDRTLRRAVAGDRSARAALVALHGSVVYGLCRRLDPHAEDAYQEIWEKVFRGLGGFDPAGRASLRTWISTVARRHLIDRHRRRSTRGEVVPMAALPPVDPAAEERVSRKQRLARLEAALARLPEAQRRVVVLHHINGVSLDALASDEGVAIGTIKSRLHRGRARLAALLGEKR